jgi:hypothetical protein
MNTQTIVLNRNNVVSGTNNTRYAYKFPTKLNVSGQEIALASLNMYYSWRNIDSGMYQNHLFTYTWWDALGTLGNEHTITIPDGNYSISTLSSYIQSQMFLKGHYIVNKNTMAKTYLISLLENPTYYACEMSFTLCPTLQQTIYLAGSGNSPWVLPNGTTQPSDYPKVIFNSSSTINNFLGFPSGSSYPPTFAPSVAKAAVYDILGPNVPETYPVSSINIQSNLCYSNIAIPNNILYTFSQGNAFYGDLIIKDPQNLIWCRIPDGIYNQLELTFVDQDFNQMKILDNQLNITILLRDI